MEKEKWDNYYNVEKHKKHELGLGNVQEWVASHI